MLGHARRATVACLMLLLVVSGCADEPDATGGPGDSAAAAELPSDQDLEAYFEAVATRDPEKLEKAEALAQPGSIAHTYAGYLLAVARAVTDGGQTPASGELTEVEGGYQGREQLDGGESCVTWADLEGADGKLVDFTIDGESLDNRLVAGGGQRVESGRLASAELLYAYESVQSGKLFVLAEIASNDEPIAIGSLDATYEDPAQGELGALEGLGPSTLGAASSATVAVIFAGARGGGPVTLPILTEDFAVTEELTLPTGAPSPTSTGPRNVSTVSARRSSVVPRPHARKR